MHPKIIQLSDKTIEDSPIIVTIKKLLNQLGLTPHEPVSSKTIESGLLTNTCREKAQQYLLNVNNSNRGYILDVLHTLKKYQNKPLSNALYLHEYSEYLFTKNKGKDYSISPPTAKTLLDFEAHYNATLVHSYYLYLRAQENQQPISLESIIEYDPLSDQHTKDYLLSETTLFPESDNLKREKNLALNYFAELITNERDLCSPNIFVVPPANNIEPYLWLF